MAPCGGSDAGGSGVLLSVGVVMKLMVIKQQLQVLILLCLVIANVEWYSWKVI